MARNLAPLILFVYNRPDDTRRTLEALKANELASETDLFIFSDAAKRPEVEPKVQEVRKIIDQASGFKNIAIHKRDKNCGLAANVIEGVSQILDQFGRAIAYEDDLISSPYALRFLNDALDAYADNPKVFTVSAYNHAPSLMKFPEDYAAKNDVYFSYRNFSYAWATWKDRWQKVDWKMSDYEQFRRDRAAMRRFARGGDDLMRIMDWHMAGRASSWAIAVSYAQFRQDAWTAAPVVSHIENIGFEGTGTHGASPFRGQKWDLNAAKPVSVFPQEPFMDPRVAQAYRDAVRLRFRSKAKLFALRLFRRIR